jgi:hypothetical protein
MEAHLTKKDYEENKKNIINMYTAKELLYYDDMNKYFKSLPVEYIEKMIEIIDTNSKISLRILDWFVTKYSNECKTTYKLDNNDDGIGFTVHIGYKSQLRTYKKKYFDPFRRFKKFKYFYKVGNKYKCFETTIGQLNFFKWCFEKRVIEFVEKNFSDLVKAMNTSNKQDKERKKHKKKLQKQITESSTTTISSESSYETSESNTSTSNKSKPNYNVLSFD